MSFKDKLSGIVDSLKSALSRVVAYVGSFFKKAARSVEHLEAIKEKLEWFVEQYPEAADKVEAIMLDLEALMEIWGIK